MKPTLGDRREEREQAAPELRGILPPVLHLRQDRRGGPQAVGRDRHHLAQHLSQLSRRDAAKALRRHVQQGCGLAAAPDRYLTRHQLVPSLLPPSSPPASGAAPPTFPGFPGTSDRNRALSSGDIAA